MVSVGLGVEVVDSVGVGVCEGEILGVGVGVGVSFPVHAARNNTPSKVKAASDFLVIYLSYHMWASHSSLFGCFFFLGGIREDNVQNVICKVTVDF